MVYIFDFDGTLADTKLSLRPVYKAGFSAIGINDISNEEFDEFMHYSLLQTLQMKNIKEEDWPAFVKTVRIAIDSPESLSLIKIFPETKEVLDKVKNDGNRIGIVSGNTSDHIRKVLSFFHLESYFEVIIGNDMYKNGKPNAEPLLLGCSLMNVEPNKDVCYVGDSLQDEECARNAGVSCFIVDRNHAYIDKNFRKGYSLLDLFK